MVSKILVLAPHTDDGDAGCGGSIARFIDEGKDVYYCAFSICEESVPEGFPKDVLKNECLSATKKLGIKAENVMFLNYKVRYFERDRQAILEDMVKLNREIKPDLVLLPSKNDLHQDHSQIATEGLRAFKKCNILGYEEIWNMIDFSSRFFIKLTDEQLDRKMDALKEYKSQGFRSYMNDDFFKGQALIRGIQINTKYAEAFEVYRWII